MPLLEVRTKLLFKFALLSKYFYVSGYAVFGFQDKRDQMKDT